MTYGHAQIGLAAAAYAKWAQLLEAKQALQAQEYYDYGYQIYPYLGQVLIKAGEYRATHGLVDALIDKGVSIDSVDGHGHSALFMASAGGKILEMNELINRGADVNLVDNSDRTPIFLAAWNGELEAVKLLVKRGARTDHLRQGVTVAEYADQYGRTDVSSYLRTLQ